MNCVFAPTTVILVEWTGFKKFSRQSTLISVASKTHHIFTEKLGPKYVQNDSRNPALDDVVQAFSLSAPTKEFLSPKLV